MPARYIREGINSSERINRLSDKSEIFYRRLLLEIDDYARYYAHPALLKAACFPLKLDKVSEEDILAWLKETVDASLVKIYKVKNTNYIEVFDFKQRKRGQSKFPDPVINTPPSDCGQSDGTAADNSQADCPHSTFYTSTSTSTINEYGNSEMSATAPTNSPTLFCKREGKKIPCKKFGSYVLLTESEQSRMMQDWGESFTKEAIKQYDTKYPNSPAIKKHTDHNRGIRDYVTRGYICQGKTPNPKKKETPKIETHKEDLPTPEDIAAVHETTKLLASKLSMPDQRRACVNQN